MKISKKQLAKWAKQEQNRSAGRVANNLEQDQAWERTKTKLQDPKVLAVFHRMKDR